MTYLDKDHNEIGETIGEVRGWIEATKYTGELYFQATGFPPVKCSWQFARQWFQECDAPGEMNRGFSAAASDFIMAHEGQVD